MKYLLAVDGSNESLDATRTFEALSQAESLCVLYVVNVPGIPYPAMGAGVAKDLSMAVDKAMREEGERIIEQAVSLLPLHPGSVMKRLENGTPAEVILTIAQEQGTDLVVLGARGIGQIQEKMFGSVSHRVMTHAPCSTLIVKKPLRKIQQVLIPIESKEDGEAVVRFLNKKPFREPISAIVLHVIPFSEPVWPVGAMISPEFRKEMITYGETFTNGISAELKQLGHQAKGVVVVGAPSPKILEAADKHAADVIMMRTHSRSGVSRFLLGSVSHSVVHQTESSILLVRD
ncbi:MAG: universal stress protein [Nitrospirota bacterium]|nr:universal stress protein [Nitrospirota bacterium]MDH5296107.1 universal stress protein [Nitrospirota bacterium]MDH5573997.1 universal stress protein [Nitrospirota bacterium]